MKRRDFLACTGAAAMAAAWPQAGRTGIAPADGDLLTRARSLVSEMSLDEKIAMMAGKLSRFEIFDESQGFRAHETPGCERLGIPGIRFIDGARGIRFKGSTCFPAAMARGATWDPALEERVGDAIGYEGRAQGANFFGGVCLNLLRHPRWGRSQETFGEDPHHLGRMAAAVVIGVQNHMMACAKHFAGNSIENTRHVVDVRMDERTLREVYLPHFKACVDAGAASIMNAYNSLNGEQCGHSAHLLRDILKGEWAFPGFVMSDWGLGIKDTVPAITGGCDVEMDRRKQYGWRLKLAVEAGVVREELIDDAVARVVGQQLRFLPLEVASYDLSKVAGPEHTALSREVAGKAIVLLKNDDLALPFSRDRIKTIAVLGSLAAVAHMGDPRGSTSIETSYAISPLDGITAAAGGEVRVVFEPGDDLAAAERAAREADAVVVVAGLMPGDEGEGHDRKGLDLDPDQEDLIRAAARANRRCVVVVEGGGAITMEAWRHEPAAIMMAWYPGMEGGNAIADALFGSVNPSGKLPIVFPKSEDQLYPFDNRSRRVEYGYYHGWRWFDKQGLEPAFPFGFGLSYTQYQYSDLRLDRSPVSPSATIRAMVDVTNVGGRTGEEIVQLYIACPGRAVDRPVKELKGFTRVALAPGETRTATFEVSVPDLAYYDPAGGDWKVESGEYRVMVGGSSHQDDLLASTVTVTPG